MPVPDAPPAEPRQRLPTLPLPPVTPPTATFILQLFLIPLLIVTIVVSIWLFFGWIAHMGRENAGELVRGIERGDNASGQLAFELAGLLRSPDSKYDALRHDTALAARLAAFLERDLAEPLTRADYNRVLRRMYLCRVIGEFHVPAGLEVLLRAAQEEREAVDIEIRFSALEAIASLADHCGTESFQSGDVVQTLVGVSREQNDRSDPPPVPTTGKTGYYRPRAELRAVAAYALGVIGGGEATQRLEQMLHDTYPNARYNAATGLARSGNEKCLGVLREMLDAANDLAVQDEANPNDQARKRTTVLLNGIKATLHLATANPAADLSSLEAALAQLVNSPLTGVTIDRSKVKSAAAEALQLIQQHYPARQRE